MFFFLANCVTGDVRLMDGDNDMEGRVELCIDETWNTVNNRQWSNIESRVVCSQLGFSDKGQCTCSIVLYCCNHFITESLQYNRE